MDKMDICIEMTIGQMAFYEWFAEVDLYTLHIDWNVALFIWYCLFINEKLIERHSCRLFEWESSWSAWSSQFECEYLEDNGDEEQSIPLARFFDSTNMLLYLTNIDAIKLIFSTLLPHS